MNKTDLIKDKMTARKNGQMENIMALDAVIADIDLVESRNNKNLTDDDVMSTMKKVISQLKESEEMYRAAGKTVEADVHVERIQVLSEYLPEQLSESELDSAVALAIACENAQSMRDMGKVITRLKEQFGASLDMSIVSRMVKERLN